MSTDRDTSDELEGAFPEASAESFIFPHVLMSSSSSMSKNSPMHPKSKFIPPKISPTTWVRPAFSAIRSHPSQFLSGYSSSLCPSSLQTSGYNTYLIFLHFSKSLFRRFPKKNWKYLFAPMAA